MRGAGLEPNASQNAKLIADEVTQKTLLPLFIIPFCVIFHELIVFLANRQTTPNQACNATLIETTKLIEKNKFKMGGRGADTLGRRPEAFMFPHPRAERAENAVNDALDRICKEAHLYMVTYKYHPPKMKEGCAAVPCHSPSPRQTRACRRAPTPPPRGAQMLRSARAPGGRAPVGGRARGGADARRDARGAVQAGAPGPRSPGCCGWRLTGRCGAPSRAVLRQGAGESGADRESGHCEGGQRAAEDQGAGHSGFPGRGR